MSDAPAGWYPVDNEQERFWDGTTWTDQIRPALPAPPTLPPPSAAAAAAPPPAHTPSTGARPDIDAALAKMTTQFGGKREIRKLPEHLWESETVSWIATGMYGGGIGILVLTNLRLLFLKDGMMRQTSEDFALSKISSIQWSSGMLTGKIQVFVSGNKSEIENVSKAEGKAIVDQVRGLLAGTGQSQTAPETPPAAPTPEPMRAAEGPSDPIAQLERLASLKDSGILTDEEFAAKKAEILARM